MSDTPITQHVDAFRSLARHHLEHGSIEGLAALKQTLEMDNETFCRYVFKETAGYLYFRFKKSSLR